MIAARAAADKGATGAGSNAPRKGASISAPARPPVMHARTHCACGGGCPSCRKNNPPQTKLEVGPPGDRFEQEADRIAEQVLARPAFADASGVQPRIQRDLARPASRHANFAPVSVEHALASAGKPLAPTLQQDREQRFGHDFSRVRVHSGAAAEQSARDLNARAYTVGHSLVFAAGQYAPTTHAGRRLLAHELTHVVQQGAGRARLRRAPPDGETQAETPAEPATDPLCESISVLPPLPEGDHSNAEQQRKLIRTLKIILRCGSEEQQAEYRSQLTTDVGAETADTLWAQAATAFGGYVGMFPQFAPDMRRRLEKLGASETLSFSDFDASARYQHRAAAAAKKEITDLGNTDILYFRGHQYAQYGAPGVFTSDGSRWVDLRYVEQTGGFANVKLLISTSCATICKEALEVFTGLFPNAVILGYRKSAPEDGKAVRNMFDSKIRGLKRGLLLDQEVDVAAIIGVWKSTIESLHKGHTRPQPGYFKAGALEYWDGTAWQTVTPTSEDNKCKRKRDHEYNLPAPP